ncbi:F-box/LRR-repeat protein 3-like [Aphidius gifuensis]|uniref:F-box/LRR-repeat protein 3-like n=1 Tax=Aphidius gifuensis TaxID=684658 RepID=UPI001CDC7A52|nr:F-box/LRR-repeat protein 3-like [Aphidius gifuensis]
METAVKNCPVEEKKKQEQLFDDADDKKNVINSLVNGSSSQLSMMLSIPEKVAEQEVGPEWIEPIKVACRNTEKYECGHSIGGVYCNRLLTQSYVEKILDLKRLKNLHSLTLSSCTLNEILQAISEKTTLTYLDLTNFRVMKNCSFNIGDVFNELVHLEHISITINKLTLNVPNCILNTCKKIRYLELPLCHNRKQPHISIKNWENLKNLEHLDIRWKITDDIAIQLVKYCKKLKYLNITGMSVDNIAFQELTKLENLECFKLGCISGFDDETMIEISNNCKKLKIFKIHLPFSLVDPIQPPSSPSSVINCLSKLQYLEQLILLGIDTNQFDEGSIIAIVNTCKTLTKLDISWSWNITETTLIALTNFESLKELKVTGIDNVTDNVISKLKGLKCFDCSNCKNITDAGVIQLINNCPDLENLNLRRTHITSDTIIGASEATKNRINNIILTIDVEWILRESFKSLNKSIWLALAINKSS